MSPRKLSHALAAYLAFACLPFYAAAETGGIAWRNNLDAAKIEATQSGRLVLLHFYTKTCGPCRVLDKTVFSQGSVGSAIAQNYVAFKVDADASPALRTAYGIERVPTDVVISPEGSYVAKLSSPPNANDYVGRLTQVAQQFRQASLDQGSGRNGRAPVNPAYANLDVQESTQKPMFETAAPQASEANPQTTPTTPTASASTANPYVTQQPAVQTNPAIGNDRYAQQQTPAAKPATVVPANAMPQSYRNPYVAEAAAPTTPPAEAPNVQPAQSVAAAQPTPPAAQQPHPAQAAAPAALATTGAVVKDRAITQTASNEVADKPGTASEVPITPTSDESTLPTGMKSGIASTSSEQAAPGSAPLGFDGCCPVTLKFANKWVRGNPAIGLEHRGRIYLFAGEKERQQFFANPDAFSPVFSGLDPVLMLEQNASVPGSRNYGYQYRGAFYLFSSEATMKKFAANPDSYSASVRQAMARIDDLNSGGTLRR